MLACLILILEIPGSHFQSARPYFGQRNSETIKKPWKIKSDAGSLFSTPKLSEDVVK